MKRYLPLFTVSLLLVACSPDAGIPSNPGAYLKKTTDTDAQLIVVNAGKQSVMIQGVFKNETPMHPMLGRIALSTISGRYSVKTPNCGTLHFVEAKGGGLFCETCVNMNLDRNLSSACELLKFDVPSIWLPMGI